MTLSLFEYWDFFLLKSAILGRSTLLSFAMLNVFCLSACFLLGLYLSPCFCSRLLSFSLFLLGCFPSPCGFCPSPCLCSAVVLLLVFALVLSFFIFFLLILPFTLLLLQNDTNNRGTRKRHLFHYGPHLGKKSFTLVFSGMVFAKSCSWPPFFKKT